MKETGYLIQAALVSAWWVGLATSQTFFEAFQYEGMTATSFWSFFAPDIVLIAILSVVRAYRNLPAIELIVLGAFAYASLYCCNGTVLTASGYLPTGLMVLGLFYNIFLCFNGSLFRTASSSLAWNTAKTLVQIVCIWVLALVVVPYVILDAFESPVVPSFGVQTWLGGTLFALCSSLGLASSYTMVRYGDGTPLPLDQTNRLVVSGPYQFVRNPMAIAGIGQGVAIAIIYLSVPILVYSLLGSVVWHIVVRPIEELDMEKRFGDDYIKYRQRVPVWWPTLRGPVD